MRRILDPAQIEAFAERSIPRLRLPGRAQIFLKRSERLRRLSAGHSIGAYLELMAAVSEAQHAALARLGAQPPAMPGGTHERMMRAREHGMPLLQANAWPRESHWRAVLGEICGSVAALAGFPAGVRAVCGRLAACDESLLEQQADRILARSAAVDVEAAPFITAALQVYYVDLVTARATTEAGALAAAQGAAAATDVPGLCPLCGSLPVASIVRADAEHQGYRYLHCGLCATEWHLVRIKCSHCLATEGIRYRFVEGGSEAVRAESCEHCRMYRKILYQEKDMSAEPLADDLASLALDLLMAAEGYQRACGNPLLWQAAGD
jgi:FdhE protein